VLIETDPAHLWDTKVVGGVEKIVVPYHIEPTVSAKSSTYWLNAIRYMEKTMLGRLDFRAVAPGNGNYLRIANNHDRYGHCGIGSGSPTTCTLRDMDVIGMDIRPQFPVVTLAPHGAQEGWIDDLTVKGQGSEHQTAVVYPKKKNGERYKQHEVIGTSFASTGHILVWYSDGYVSAGWYPDLGNAIQPQAITYPPGAGPNPKPLGFAAGADPEDEEREVTYSWWKVGSDLYVAIGSLTVLQRPGTSLTKVELPPGRTVDRLIDMEFDTTGRLHTWFIPDPTIEASVGPKPVRFVGTYADLNGESDVPPVYGETYSTYSLDSIGGIAIRPTEFPVVTLFADLAANEGWVDDLEQKGWDKYLSVTLPVNPDTGVSYGPDDVLGIAFDTGDRVIAWYKNGYRSKGFLPKLGDVSPPAAFSLPPGTTSASVLGFAVHGDAVYSWYDLNGAAFVAKGSSTSLGSALEPVTLPAGKSASAITELAMDAGGKVHTWFGPTLRYVGTPTDLDGPENRQGAKGSGLKGTGTAGIALHELGHAMGLKHEHQRRDRDDWLTYGGDGHRDYDVVTDSSQKELSGFDFASVMLYESNKHLKRADGSSYDAQRRSLSWHDVSGINRAYGFPDFTAAQAATADAATENGLAYSPLRGMTDADLRGADFDEGGTLHSWYGHSTGFRHAWGHEYDLDRNGSGKVELPFTIDGGNAELLSVAMSKTGDGLTYAWYERTGPAPASCSSRLYRSRGSSSNLTSNAPPDCVSVYDASHDADDVVGIATDVFSGTHRVYALFDDGTVSVGSSLNWSKAPVPYALPGGVSPRNVRAFALRGGTAYFFTKDYKLHKDPNFASKF
jgi:hypothetical protein